MFEKRDAGEFRRLQTPALQELARRPDEALDVDEDEPLASARRSYLIKGVQARFEGYEHLPYESSHWDRTVETSNPPRRWVSLRNTLRRKTCSRRARTWKVGSYRR